MWRLPPAQLAMTRVMSAGLFQECESASARCVYFPDSDNLVIRKPLLPSGYCEVGQSHNTSPSQQSLSRLFSGQCTATLCPTHSFRFVKAVSYIQLLICWSDIWARLCCTGTDSWRHGRQPWCTCRWPGKSRKLQTLLSYASYPRLSKI